MEKTREQIDAKYKWKLEDMYASREEWEKDYKLLVNEIDKIKMCEKTFLNSARNLYNYLVLDEKISRTFDKLYSFASMKSDEDKSNNHNLELVDKASNIWKKISEANAFVIPAFLEKDYSLIEKYYEELPELKKWEISLKEIYRYKDHSLSKEQRKIISSFSKVLDTGNRVSSILRNSDMELGKIKDENGQEVTLTDSSYGILITSKNREVRKNAFMKLYKCYEQFANTFSNTLASTIEYSTVDASIKNFNSSLEASLFSDEVNTDVYFNLINNVKKGLPILFDYYKIKKELLKLDEYHLYDTYVGVIGESNKKYTFDEAKKLVIDGLSILGDEYITELKKAFTDSWIDIYPNKGKRNGAYSWGCYDSKPYVLLNYEGQLDDVSTLAHELGHSMHSFYTTNNNPYQTAHYTIFVAEVASTVNEILLNKYLLSIMNDKSERLVILNNLLDTFKGTIFRQTMFAEFEMKIHAFNEQGETLTNELLSKTYYDLNKEYFGPDVVVDEPIKYEWARIPHFYTPFYVYKYATGLSAACQIATNILDGKEKACENYIEFLKSGNRQNPIELLKIAGVDMNNPDVILSAINMFKDILEEFKSELSSEE